MTVVSKWFKEKTMAEQLIALGIANLFLIVCSQVRIPLPFTPVPITGQTFGILLLGALLGSRYGTAVVIAYVLEGAIGLPVFSGWKGGIAVLFGPTGGYIFGFIFAAFVVGWLVERDWLHRLDLTFATLLIGNAVIYAFGLPWLALYVGWDKVLQLGLIPFLFGDLVKLVVAASIARALYQGRARF